MVEGARQVSLPFEPVRRPLVQHGHEFRLVPLELPAEDVAEEAVVAVAPARPVERDEEEVGALDPLELVRRAGRVERRVAQRPRQLTEHRRPAEKGEAIGDRRERCSDWKYWRM